MFALRVASNHEPPYDPLMTEPTTPDDEPAAESPAKPPNRVAATVISIGFLAIVVAGALVLTARSHESQEPGEAPESTETPTSTSTTATTTTTTTSSSTPTTTTPTTTARPTTSTPPVRTSAAAPRPTQVPAAPVAPATTAGSAAPATSAAESSERKKPELNVTRDPTNMSPLRPGGIG